MFSIIQRVRVYRLLVIFLCARGRVGLEHEFYSVTLTAYSLTGHGSTFDLRSDGLASRPCSAQPYGSNQSYSTAVSIYSQRLSRPRSASSSGTNRQGRCQMVMIGVTCFILSLFNTVFVFLTATILKRTFMGTFSF